MNGLQLVRGHLKAQDLIRADSSLFDQAAAADYDEKFPLALMSMMSLRDSRF